jgi:two-component system NtrC family sensor kinase
VNASPAWSVLIVDDSLTVRMDLAEAFQAAGFAATPCESATAARDALSRSAFDLLVLDVLLPDGDGVELLARLKQAASTADLPVILLSSESEVRDRIRGLKTGADEYVGKPYDTDYIVARAAELVRRGATLAPTGSAVTVLLIDDSPSYQDAMRKALESAGYSVVVAPTGEDGLRAAVQTRPGAIIVDGVMPGIDGATVLRHVRQDAALRRTPCILLTASPGSSGELEALDAGADAYLEKGAETSVILARLAALLRATGAPAVAEAGLLGPKKVLAVDDSLTYLEELAEQLRQSGYDVLKARSGEEALELLAVQEPDCILLDVIMPGLSGYETCRLIKQAPRLRDIPLLMLSARDERDAMLEGINVGADDYIPKSSDYDVLRARLRAQLRRKQFEDENRTIREQFARKELEATEARAALTLAESRAALMADVEAKNAQLEELNKELETFSYSVSHDLRAPLRVISGFSEILVSDHAAQLDPQGLEHLHRVRNAANRMGQLIDDFLALSRVARGELRRVRVDLSFEASQIAAELKAAHPGRALEFRIAPGLVVAADRGLVRVVLANLLGNAVKFTARKAQALIEVGVQHEGETPAYLVRDNGVGFDMTYATKLFRPFQRLHGGAEFDGTGIGLATVLRVVKRHGGRAWTQAAPNQGATFFFTLTPAEPGL